VRRDDPDQGVPHGGGEDLGRPGRRPAAFTDADQRPDEGTDHVVAERVGDDGADGDPAGVALPVETKQRPHGRGALAAAAEGGEVVLTQQKRGRLVHDREIQ
jgi:hypothetical protein